MDAHTLDQSLLSYEGEVHLRITNVKFEDWDAVLTVQLTDVYGQDDDECWDIRAVNLMAHEISDIGGEFDVLDDEHILIRELVDQKQQLFLNSSTESPYDIVGRLYSAHLDIASDWITFRKYLNECCRLEEVLTAGHGLVADGPLFLIALYEEVLVSAGLKTNKLSSRPSKVWDGSSWNEVPNSVRGLTIGGTYFLAESFVEIKRG